MAMINEGVTAALAARDATQNGDDSHTSGTGVRRPVQVARECTYPDFLKCQPLNFKGTEGVVGLTQWFKKIESVYSISNCTVACQLPFAMPWEVKGIGCGIPQIVNTRANQRVVLNVVHSKEFQEGLPKLKKNNIRGKQVGNAKAQAIKKGCYARGLCRGKPGQSLMSSRVTFSLNKRYASFYYDTGADRSFVSTCILAPRIVITLNALDLDYYVELADGRIVRFKHYYTDGCSLNLLNHPFNIEPKMPIELANITTTKDEDKLKEKRLKDDAQVVQEFPEVFLWTCRHRPNWKELGRATVWKTYGTKGFIRPSSSPGDASRSVCKEEKIGGPSGSIIYSKIDLNVGFYHQSEGSRKKSFQDCIQDSILSL
ncbi:hypothetical protein Tco_0134013 [Tanacetum coccineum]